MEKGENMPSTLDPNKVNEKCRRILAILYASRRKMMDKLRLKIITRILNSELKEE